MYSLTTTNQFEKDYKLCRKRGYKMELINSIFLLLEQQGFLPPNSNLTNLKGNTKAFGSVHLHFSQLHGRVRSRNFKKTFFMEAMQFETTISSLTEIKIPDNLKEKIQLNQEVRVLLIPARESLYEDWKDDEWNKLSMLHHG